MQEIYNEFTLWLEKNLINLDETNINSYCFNLYEDDTSYHVQLIGSSSTPEEDEDDWACDEVYSTHEDIFIIKKEVAGENWENGLDFSTNLVKKYIEAGKYSNILKRKNCLGIGFVDGDIEIIY